MNAVSVVWNRYQEEYNEIKNLYAELPKWVDETHIRQDLIPTIGAAAIIITIVFGFNTLLLKRRRENLQNPYKAAYQLTNLMVNFTLGVLGVYFHYKTRVYDISELPMTDLAVGNLEVYPVASLQFGYNLWAIPVGLFVVQESPVMILHHVSVIVTSFMTLFLPLGYRYFAPFMFGILEISSVPLAVMNAFKDHAALRDGYPQAFKIIRVVFAVTFLYVRWYLYLPIKYDYLRLYGMGVLCTPRKSSPWLIYYTSIVWLASFFLLILQLFWGIKISKALVKIIISSNNNKKEEKPFKTKKQ